jgi:4-amino-4-deoxy-L-arabinose transferase-like glycosyltransferase
MWLKRVFIGDTYYKVIMIFTRHKEYFNQFLYMTTKIKSNHKTSLLTVWGLFALLLVLSTLLPLSLPDEGRYAEIGRWMLQSGDWLTPRLNGMPFFHKPPLLYWLEGLFFGALGAHPWVARLTPVLHAGLMLATLYQAVRRVGSEALARRAAVMLGTSLALLAGGQYVNHDMMVATWVSIAIGCFAMAFMAGDRPDPALARLGFVACALGVLSKGLLGVALPGMVMMIWLVWTHQLKKIILLPWFSGLGLFGVIALPWFFLAEQRFPNMLNYLFGMHHFQRLTGTSFNNNMPWWFYLLALLILFFPWVFFALAQGYKSRSPGQSDRPSFPTGLISLCWIWVVAIIGFFSLPAAKVIGYALPVIPPLAVLAALGWQQVMGQRPRERQLFIAVSAVNIALALGLTLAMGQHTLKRSAKDVGLTFACLSQPGDTLYVLDGFPYDMPFIAKMTKPMLVVQDWAALRLLKSDNWHSELLDAADFDTEAAKVLQTPAQLALTQAQPGNWLLTPSNFTRTDVLVAWHKVKQGRAWTLYRTSASSTPLDTAKCDIVNSK